MATRASHSDKSTWRADPFEPAGCRHGNAEACRKKLVRSTCKWTRRRTNYAGPLDCHVSRYEKAEALASFAMDCVEYDNTIGKACLRFTCGDTGLRETPRVTRARSELRIRAVLMTLDNVETRISCGLSTALRQEERQ